MGARRIGGHMYFTEGRHQQFEREMQSTPGFGRNPKTIRERDCPYCLHWDENKKRCKEPHCIVFDD